MSSTERQLPANRDAEMAVLGAVLIQAAAWYEVAGDLRGLDFFFADTREVFEAMAALHERGAPIDVLSLVDELRVRGAKTLADAAFPVSLAQSVTTAENVRHYIEIVRDKANLRRFIQFCGEHASRAFGEDAADAPAFLDEAEAELFKLNAARVRPTSTTTALAMPVFIERIEERQQHRREVRGVPTGLVGLDRMLGGLAPGNLIVLGGRPGMGKTQAALNWVGYAALRRSIPCLIFSLEMTADELIERLASSDARIDGDRLRTGSLSGDEFKDIYASAIAFSKVPVTIDEGSPQTIAQIAASARRWRSNPSIFPREAETGSTPPLGLIVVDYLQLAVGLGGRKSDTREQEVGDITRGLKALAKAVRCPIIGVSQLNRELEKRTDKRPQLSDLRESGSIEQDADVIVFVHREGYFADEPGARQGAGVAEFIVRKHRHGDTGTVRAMWNPKIGRFDNYADDPGPTDR